MSATAINPGAMFMHVLPHYRVEFAVNDRPVAWRVTKDDIESLVRVLLFNDIEVKITKENFGATNS